MRKNFPVILFFIASSAPTPDEQAAAMEFGPNVRFRNVQFVPETVTALETCDGVAGCVPEAYKKCPTAEEAVDKYMRANHAAIEQARDAADAATQARETAQATEAANVGKQAGKAAAKAAETPPAAATGWTPNA